MVRRHLTRPHRFVCLTDRPYALRRVREQEPVSYVQVPTPYGMKGWWSKVALFHPQRFTGRVLYLDLDTIVVASLDPIVDFPERFALVPDAGTFQPMNRKLAVVKRYNSSVMVWDAGVPDRLQTRWTKAVTRRLWGDQDWIGEQMPQAATMPAAWFPRISALQEQPPNGEARVVLCKVPKNVEAAAKWPWVREHWR